MAGCGPIGLPAARQKDLCSENNCSERFIGKELYVSVVAQGVPVFWSKLFFVTAKARFLK